MSLLLTADDGCQCILVEDIAVDAIRRIASIWHPKETGGILLGYYDTNFRLVTICQASDPPPDSKHGYAYFDRGIVGVEETIMAGKIQSSALDYVGEWHTHPGGKPQASKNDIRQMQNFSQRRLYGVSSPILLVAGGLPSNDLQWQATVHYDDYHYRSLKIIQ